MRILLHKFKDSALSVIPIVILVLILNFTISPIETEQLIRFLIGALFIILGLSIFLMGVDLGIDEIGQHMGDAIAKSNKLIVVIVAGLLLGFFISVAEPDLHILAGQIDKVTSGAVSKWGIVIIVSLGIAVLLSAGLLRIVYNFGLHKKVTILYGIIFVIAL